MKGNQGSYLLGWGGIKNKIKNQLNFILKWKVANCENKCPLDSGLGGVLACTSEYTCLIGYINSHHATIVMYVQWIIFTWATNTLAKNLSVTYSYILGPETVSECLKTTFRRLKIKKFSGRAWLQTPLGACGLYPQGSCPPESSPPNSEIKIESLLTISNIQQP